MTFVLRQKVLNTLAQKLKRSAHKENLLKYLCRYENEEQRVATCCKRRTDLRHIPGIHSALSCQFTGKFN